MANCLKCEQLKDCPWSSDPEVICSAYQQKPMTNADRIRTMTDEELSNFLAGIEHDACCASTYLGDGTYIDHWLDWLKEEVKEDKRWLN